MPDRLTRATALAVLETTAIALPNGIAKARALTDVLREYRNDQNTAKVTTIAALIVPALGAATGDEAERLNDDALYFGASVSDSSTTAGQAAWQAYLDNFDADRTELQKFNAYLQAARYLPTE